MRVCNNNSYKYSNCSKCRKCIITMLYFTLLGHFDKLKDTFLLPDKDGLDYLLLNYHIDKQENSNLSTLYYNKIYEGFLKLYISNNCNPLTNIIENYTGDFENEDYILTTRTK